MRNILAVALTIGLWPQSADACPAAIPQPANAYDVQCFTLNKPVNVRCATAISPTLCNTLNNRALSFGLVTQDGYNYLLNIGFCAMVADYGEGNRIYDFCPMGCFASDTKMLTGTALNNSTSYAAASSVKPQSRLMSLADDASLGEVLLASRSIKRTVSGPEDADLYVFALSNGSTLRVTSHHPMVIDSGKVIEASEVTTQMAFVGANGQSVAIGAITREKAVADVFNFETVGDTQMSHIIVAEGVLVGDLKLQNELADEEGSINFRR